MLRPGGRAVVSVWGHRSACGCAEVFPLVEARVASDVCPLFFQLGTGETLTAHLQAKGFVEPAAERIDVTCITTRRTTRSAPSSPADPWRWSTFKFDDQTREVVHAEYPDSIEAYRTNVAYDVPGEFVVARGVRPSG